MASTKLVNINGKGPAIKSKSGKFEVSIWQWVRYIPPTGDTKDLFCEKQIDVHRACIRYSQWNRTSGSWDESSIWCSIDDLRSLVQALDNLNFTDSAAQEEQK